jgi:hypothetical protein
MSCWAASMRMILASRLRLVASDDDIAAATGDQTSLSSGLDPNETKCLKHWGFRMLYPQTFTGDGFANLVSMHGPLWVACDVRFPGASRSVPHIRVVTGVRSLQSPMMLQVNDPGPVGVGSRYQESYDEFVRKNELLGFQELKEPSPIYVAYLA